MDNLHHTTPANDAGTHARSIDTSDATMSDQVAVCANGDVIPLTRGQNRGNIYETGAPISEQFGRADIVFVCSASMADKWPTRASVIARAAEHIAHTEKWKNIPPDRTYGFDTSGEALFAARYLSSRSIEVMCHMEHAIAEGGRPASTTFYVRVRATDQQINEVMRATRLHQLCFELRAIEDDAHDAMSQRAQTDDERALVSEWRVINRLIVKTASTTTTSNTTSDKRALLEYGTDSEFVARAAHHYLKEVFDIPARFSSTSTPDRFTVTANTSMAFMDAAFADAIADRDELDHELNALLMPKPDARWSA